CAFRSPPRAPAKESNPYEQEASVDRSVCIVAAVSLAPTPGISGCNHLDHLCEGEGHQRQCALGGPGYRRARAFGKRISGKNAGGGRGHAAWKPGGGT